MAIIALCWYVTVLDRGFFHSEIQVAIDAETDADIINLSNGLCGKALVDIQAKSCPVMMPRVDDCIAMILYDQRTDL